MFLSRAGIGIGDRVSPIFYVAVRDRPRGARRIRVCRWPTGGIRIFFFRVFVALGGGIGARVKMPGLKEGWI